MKRIKELIEVMEGWYALFLCIVKGLTPDKSISIMNGKYLRSSKGYRKKAK